MMNIRGSDLIVAIYSNERNGWNIQVSRRGFASKIVAKGPHQSLGLGLQLFKKIENGEFNIHE